MEIAAESRRRKNWPLICRHREREMLRARPAEYTEVLFRVAALNLEKAQVSCKFFSKIRLGCSACIKGRRVMAL